MQQRLLRVKQGPHGQSAVAVEVVVDDGAAGADGSASAQEVERDTG